MGPELPFYFYLPMYVLNSENEGKKKRTKKKKPGIYTGGWDIPQYDSGSELFLFYANHYQYHFMRIPPHVTKFWSDVSAGIRD